MACLPHLPAAAHHIPLLPTVLPGKALVGVSSTLGQGLISLFELTVPTQARAMQDRVCAHLTHTMGLDPGISAGPSHRPGKWNGYPGPTASGDPGVASKTRKALWLSYT